MLGGGPKAYSWLVGPEHMSWIVESVGKALFFSNVPRNLGVEVFWRFDFAIGYVFQGFVKVRGNRNCWDVLLYIEKRYKE